MVARSDANLLMYTSASVSKMASQVAIIGVKVLPQDSAAVLYFLFLKFLLEDRIVFKGVPLCEGASALRMQQSNNASLKYNNNNTNTNNNNNNNL